MCGMSRENHQYLLRANLPLSYDLFRAPVRYYRMFLIIFNLSGLVSIFYEQPPAGLNVRLQEGETGGSGGSDGFRNPDIRHTRIKIYPRKERAATSRFSLRPRNTCPQCRKLPTTLLLLLLPVRSKLLSRTFLFGHSRRVSTTHHAFQPLAA